MQGVEDHLASDDMDPVPFSVEDVDRWTTVGGPRRDSVTVEILLQPALLLLTFATLVVNLVGQTSCSCGVPDKSRGMAGTRIGTEIRNLNHVS